jgi:hypothetical protein
MTWTVPNTMVTAEAIEPITSHALRLMLLLPTTGARPRPAGCHHQ